VKMTRLYVVAREAIVCKAMALKCITPIRTGRFATPRNPR